jgi:DNA-directed RNA polymerase subunit L/DNA-directed RNA polymerase alpha subunit
MEPVFSQYQGPTGANERAITFQFAKTHVAFANTLRRLCMTAVEMVCFRADMTDKGTTTDVVIKENSTPMTNEMLAHRIGLIPIFVEKPTEWERDKYKFVLRVENMSSNFRDVTTADFLVQDVAADRQVDHQLFFKPDPITGDYPLIAVLKPQMPGASPEVVHIEAYASKGVGRENARFIPTTQCAYGYTRDPDPARQEAFFERWLGMNKKGTLAELKQNDPAKLATLKREFDALEINRCYLVDSNNEPYSFDFTVESLGVLTPQYIVARALENGAALCERFTKDSLPEDVVVQFADANFRGYDFIFQNQDHTLGHLVQAWMDKHLVGNGEITFAGYDVPHPLRDEMVIRVGVAGNDDQEKIARKALKDAMTACATMFRAWRTQWSEVAGGARPGTAAKPTGAKPKRSVLRPVAA